MTARVGSSITFIVSASLIAFLVYFLPIPAEPISYENYRPVHLLMETFVGFIGALIFILGWNSLKRELTGTAILMTCGFLGVAVIALFHVLGHTGLEPIFPAFPLNRVVFYEMVSRLFAAFALNAAAFRLWPKPISARMKYASLGISLAILLGVYIFGNSYLDLIPPLNIKGVGNTPFRGKIGAVNFLLFLMAATGSFRQIEEKDGTDFRLVFVASCILAISDFVATIQPETYGKMGLVSQMYKVVAYWIIFRAIFVSNFRLPYLKLESSERQLRQAVQIRDEFLSIAAHELRTPLTPLRAQFQLFDMELKQVESGKPIDPSKLLKYTRNIGGSLERLTRLVNNLLDVATVRSGQHLSLKLERCSLAQIIRTVLERNAAELRANGMSAAFDASSSVEGLWDPLRMEQVLANLISNSIKYARGAPIRILLKSSGGRVQLCYADQGGGIPEEKLSGILEPFSRAAPELGAPGLGLGLFIVKKVVEAHGGSIRVRSERGKGTTFLISLPLRNAATKSMRAAS
jgi:signal transduction histidine kinase